MLFPIVAALIGLTIFYGGGTLQKHESIPELPGLLVPQSTGKERQIVSMTHDASMYTERVRRVAIIGNHKYGKAAPIHESRTSIGSTNGSMEANFLTAITKCISDIIDIIPFPVTGQTLYESGDLTDNAPADLFIGGTPSNEPDLLESTGPGSSSDEDVTVFDGVDPLEPVMNYLYSVTETYILNLDSGVAATNATAVNTKVCINK
jgi:hypothetical protein